jgi:ACS family D-galactonate transporter-like MFS transporter
VPILGFLVFRLGWRWSFIFTGFVSFLYFLLFWGVYRNPSEDPRLSPDERTLMAEGRAQPESAPAEKSHGAPMLYLLRQPQVIGATIGFAAYNYVFYLVLTWLPNYLSMSLRVDLLHSALDTSVPWLVATFTDLAIGGWMVDALVRRGARPWLVRQCVLVGGLAFGMRPFMARRFAHTAAGCSLPGSVSAMAGLGAMAPVGWSMPVAHCATGKRRARRRAS